MDQDPYWMALIEEYRAYRAAWRFYEQGIKTIMNLPERQRAGIVDMLVGMRKAQGLPMDEHLIFEEMQANEAEAEEDEDW